MWDCVIEGSLSTCIKQSVRSTTFGPRFNDLSLYLVGPLYSRDRKFNGCVLQTKTSHADEHYLLGWFLIVVRLELFLSLVGNFRERSLEF